MKTDIKNTSEVLITLKNDYVYVLARRPILLAKKHK